jgi:Flp pilus assembly protein TadB
VVVDSELERRIRRIAAIRAELQSLYSKTQPGLTAAGVGIWIVSGGLTVAGLALAVPSGGSSLLLSVAGMIVFLIDMARQIQTYAQTREQRAYARQLEQELVDHAEFIRRFGTLR